MSDWKLIYSHGRDGHPWNDPKTIAVKSIADENNLEMLSIEYDESDTVQQMIDQAFSFCHQAHSPPTNLILVGSSRGAYILSAVTHLLYKATGQKIAGLYMMAPAIDIKHDYYPGEMQNPVTLQTEVVHPYHDEVVPVGNTIEFCTKHNITLHLVNDTHCLQNQVEFIKNSARIFIENCLTKPV